MSRILIVDDDVAIGRQLELLLTRRGYKTVHATNGTAALAAAEEWKPDLVLLDVLMPGMDGFEVLQRMRQLNSTVSTPIIMLTALSSMPDKTKGFEGGADDYIVKPFTNSELCLRIEAHLRRQKDLVPEPPSTAMQPPPKLPLVIGKQRSGIFRQSYKITKRLFDLVVSLVALPFALPLMAIIALIIKLDSPGPVIFKQKRTGMNGERFTMYKFRTMFENAEELKEKYAHLNHLTWPDFKIVDDPRVTRVGKFLRKTSLDELPQLFNVLKGDMSLVGPRPTSFSADTYKLWQTERLEVRPGLTGLWQVNGRSDTDFEERSELDIEYIERQSWKLDLMILFHTFSAVLMGRGSY
ncbi:MAG TPA: exopolysaccharide biosynthesis polyprenyl glycosylphosphotransferase [Aggregatilineales bacterium]|nr:exopolysaccharide biosynthesis polyprenyl glycosylphosphotransferase [Aggregatilineales bacterium]